MIYTDDPVRDFDRYDQQQAEELKRLPECCECGHPIQQERAVCIHGDWYCDECLEDFRRDIE